MRLFQRVAIVGTGLIGGSIALGLKKNALAREVIGFSRRKKTLLLASKIGAIDRGSQDIRVIKGADLVILAAPVSTILGFALAISKIIPADCIVTDVGSTKKEIVSRLERIFPRFVGAHPLAGSEKQGIQYAAAGIFKESLFILTPTNKTDSRAVGKVKMLWAKLGSKVVFMTPDAHDKILSFVSHLPHIAAFATIGSVPSKYLRFSSTGLKDTTRLAASDSKLWADIFFSNRENMLKSISLLEGNLARIKSAIKNSDENLLVKILKEARRKREALG
jgi:prephenate dehydrogenase